MTTFEKKFAKVMRKQRRDIAINSFETIQNNILSGKILSLTFTSNKEWGEPDDTIIVDYSVDLSDGKNISDLGLESLEDAINDIATRLKNEQ